MTRLRRARADRAHTLTAWLNGGTPDGSPRWDGDDGRQLSMVDILQMRLDLAEPLTGTAVQRAAWQKIINAERARWAELDAAYEAAKTAR